MNQKRVLSRFLNSVWFLPILACLVTLGIHFAVVGGRSARFASQWFLFEESTPWSIAFTNYLRSGEIYLGFSYALAAGFTVLMVGNLIRNRKRAFQGVAAGASIGAFLYLGGCFLVGCCGSPLLPVYLSLFGAKALSITKPLIAGVTTASVSLSYIFLVHRKGAPCCPTDTDNDTC
jgi:hypothetical protein